MPRGPWRILLPALASALVASLPVGVAARPSGAPARGAPAAGASDDLDAGGRSAARPAARLRSIGRFSAPVYVTAPPGDPTRVFVVERPGRIRIVRDGKKLRQPFLDIRDQVLAGAERGLLSMAFAPDYEQSGRFYVFFTDRRGTIRVQELSRSQGDPDRADRSTRRQVLSQRHPRTNHNGGLVAFGPDGLLYIGMGDGGGRGDPGNNAQDLGSLLGKILRIDPRPAGRRPYRVPRTNPFARRRGARGEIYSYGLRNPWRFSFDRRTGDLAIGDVGQDRVEEIDFAPRGGARGANFGWPVFEGRRRFSRGSAPGHVRPVIERSHSSGDCSITGGYVVRDRSLGRLAGRYLYGDYCTGRIRSARLRRGRARGNAGTGLRVPLLSSFGEDARGRVHVTSLGGRVYRIVPR